MPKTWPGVVKVKMLHRPGATVLLPEVLVVGGAGNQWVQPQFVYAPSLWFTDDDATATMWLAALDNKRKQPAGLECEVAFSRGDRLATLADSSEVYRCTVVTEHSPAELAVGRARLRADGGISLRLYHHTARSTLPQIHASAQVRGSAWNYQGNRELANVAYAYFTSLPSIRTEDDLRRIAMASDGRIGFQLDTTHGGGPDLVLDVYRGSTRDRKATLALWVPSETISTPHVWQHTAFAVYYEIAHPWIYRAGLIPGGHLGYKRDTATPDPAMLKRFDYAVIGDCTTIEGLEAPFDEENTSETFLIQDLTGTDLFEFWRTHANTPLHAAPTDTQAFKP